ncbi:uncharacterized protein K02A2.6-like [Topomyia yanbarensis]|uniref:uncharacterized protein K02A2.6-like n=1 Tax=Topomyia yanbarensis TaxID=2498891 RepID=UPI00273CEF76|nr:uncharacterized protein K02A2.6-like [Topomyia yanbarensis]
MGNADFCSRFPLSHDVPRTLDHGTINNINFSQEFPVDSEMVAKETSKDAFLQQVISFLYNGWPERLDRQFINVFSNQQDLEYVDGCLLYQDRVIIPKSMQNGMLKLLHANHSGVVKMKQIARRSVYWYGINADIERFANSCDACNRMAVVPKPKVTSSWIPTIKPFSRIHADFFFFDWKSFLLIVDSFSKWIEVIWMKQGTDTKKVLKKFIEFFARFGLPDVIVTDGGPPFNSFVFVEFLEKQGIKVMKSPPYNPSSNGQAERSVRTVKDVLKKFFLDPDVKKLDLEDQVNLFLLTHRNSCLKDHGRFPSERVFSFKPKTIIDLVNPKRHYTKSLKRTIPPDDTSQKSENDLNDPDNLSSLRIGDVLWYKSHNPHDISRWIKGQFLMKISKNIFQIALGDIKVIAHRRQIRPDKSLMRSGAVIVRQPEKVYEPTTSRKRAWPDSDSDDYDGEEGEEKIFRGFPEKKRCRTQRCGEMERSAEVQAPDTDSWHSSFILNSSKQAIRRSERIANKYKNKKNKHKK